MKSLLIIMFILCTILIAGCSEQEGLNEPSSAAFEMRLKEDADVQELLSIRDEMIKRALDSGVGGAEISDVVVRNDTERFAAILEYSEEEMAELGSRIAYLGKVIQDRYPKLKDMAGSRREECPGCDFKAIAEKWNDISARHREPGVVPTDGEVQIPLPDPSQKGVTCQWVLYAASLAVCTTAGPVLYWACALVATCALCTGGWVSTMCQS